MNKRTEILMSLLLLAGQAGIWFLLRPGTWGERVATLCFMLISLVIIAAILYFYGQKVKDRPKS